MTVHHMKSAIALVAVIGAGCAAQSSTPPRQSQNYCLDEQIHASLISNDRFDIAFLRLRNRSPVSCSLRGYPSVKLLDAYNQEMAAHDVHTADAKPRTVVLRANGGWAIASLDSPRTGPAGSCETSAAVTITIPRLARQRTYRNERSYCLHGEIRVSPIYYPASGNLPLPT